jgi:hypothetical protein
MPKWRGVHRRCEACGASLTLLNARDLERKRFCSRSCRSGTVKEPVVLTLSQRQEEVLAGILLGDGSVVKKRPSDPSARISYASVHPGLAELVAAELPLRVPFKVPSSFCGKPARDQWRTYSAYSVSLLPVRYLWYPHGEKAVPANVVLTPTTCLFWHLGDGSFSGRVNLATHGFGWGNVNGVILPKLWGIGFSSAVAYPDGGAPRVYFSPSDSARWLNFIGGCPVPALRHRWEDVRASLVA